MSPALDERIRAAAIRHVRALESQLGVLPWSILERGFNFDGTKIHLVSRPRGIFKPTQLSDGALSIRTAEPRRGRERRYDDEIGGDAGYFLYHYQGEDPQASDNRELRKCLTARLPVIYFYPVSVGVYRPIVVHVVGEADGYFHVRPVESEASLGILPLVADQDPVDGPDRMTLVKQRIHQDRFREAVRRAYRTRCAFCELHLVELLDAAHIIPYRERRGVTQVQNGLCLCKLHHAAFDADLLGLSPALRVAVRPDIRRDADGHLFRVGLQELHDVEIVKPEHRSDWPDASLVEERWTRFESQ